jgi:hypothetical protein
MPLVVNYGKDILSEDCGSCHTGVYDMIANNTTKHRQVTCIACHENKHGTIPACEKCHDRPHPEAMLVKFGHCGVCHGTAHELQASGSIFLKTREAEK